MAGPGSTGALRPGTGTGAERRRPPPAASPALRRARHRLRVSAGAAAPMRGRAGPIRPARSARHGTARRYRYPRCDPFASLSRPPGPPPSAHRQHLLPLMSPSSHPHPSSHPLPRDPQGRDGDDVDCSTILGCPLGKAECRPPPPPSCTQSRSTPRVPSTEQMGALSTFGFSLWRGKAENAGDELILQRKLVERHMILIRVDNMNAINTKAEMCGEADELPRCPQLLSSAVPQGSPLGAPLHRAMHVSLPLCSASWQHSPEHS